MGLLDNFKKNRDRASSMVKSAVEDKGYTNEFYYPERDQQGAASVVIRFLPQKDPEAVPFVSLFRHMFKGDDGKWVVADLCATTIGGECEICKRNSILWNTNNKDKQAIARARKRKKEYICNVLVVKDPKSPEKEGKVFPYRFGPTIYEKIKSAISPSYEDESGFNPFDLWEGADFLLRIRKDSQSKQITYDDSKFAQQSMLCDGDEEKIVKLLDQCVDLSKYIDPSLVINNDELARKCDSAYADTISQNSAPSFENKTVSHAEPPKKEVFEFPEASVSNKQPNAQVMPSESLDDEPLNAFKAMVNQVPF